MFLQKHRSLPAARASSTWLLLCIAFLSCSTVQGWAQTRTWENLNRGIKAQYTGSAVYVSWRLLKTDAPSVTFDLYRKIGSGSAVKLNASPLAQTTDFVDTSAPASSTLSYYVVPIVGGSALPASETIPVSTAAAKNYISINVGDSAGKVGIGDLDGDGAYDFVVRTPQGNNDPWYWVPSTSTYKLLAFKSDGTLLWTYDMGPNIEMGVWYSPFVVYDFDGDGKAEVALKTAPLTPDYSKSGTTDVRVTQGAESLSILNGLTGQIVSSMPWPDRTELGDYQYYARNQIGVAFLDGQHPFIIVARGTYGVMKATAVQYAGGVLSARWSWKSSTETAPGNWAGQGAHSMRCADVDNDGRDEIFLGSAVLDDDGTGLWTNGLGHCDHAYVGDIDPSRPGLEVYYGYEDGRTKNGWNLSDAATGQILWGSPNYTYHLHDEGLVSDIDPAYPGMETFSGERDYPDRWYHSAAGASISHKGLFFDNLINYRAAYWDADLQREAIVRNTLYNFPTQPVTVAYSKLFAGGLAEWVFSSSDPAATITAESGRVHIVHGATTGSWNFRTIAPIPVVPGEKYRITACGRNTNAATNPTEATLSLNVETLNGSTTLSPNILTQVPSVSGSVSQTELTATFTIPSGVDGIRPAFLGNRGHFYLSDLMIVKDPDLGRSLATAQGFGLAWADISGDWREEVITSYSGELRIYSTAIPATDRRVTLMQDALYRADVAHVAMGYDQVPTTSYCLAQPAGQSQTVQLLPLADSLARGGGYAGTNYGTLNLLMAMEGTSDVHRRSYLRFNLGTLPTTSSITKATLRLFVTTPTSNSTNAVSFVPNDTWQENTLCWNNMPAPSTPVLDSKAVSMVGQWIEFDVTGRAQAEFSGDKLLSLVVTSLSTYLNVTYSSKEGNYPPQLVIELAGGGTAVNTLNAATDSYVHDGTNANTNFGSSTSLGVKLYGGTGNNRIAYLKFDVSALPSNVSTAVLEFNVLSDNNPSGTPQLAIYPVANDSWAESTLTWNNRPTEGTILASGNAEGGTTVALDITSEVRAAAAGDNVLSLAIKGINSEYYMELGSREGGTPARIFWTP